MTKIECVVFEVVTYTSSLTLVEFALKLYIMSLIHRNQVSNM